MVQYIVGDIFESPAQTIVNTVNTVGVMGKGLALRFKQRYPEMFKAYREMCERHKLTTGKLMIYSAPDHRVLLFPTKENWRNPSKIEYIESGLQKFVDTYSDHGITSIAFPRLGCGNGELHWDEVKPVMECYLSGLPIDIYIYISDILDPEPEHRDQKKTLEWLKENAKDLSFDAVCDDIMISSTLFPLEFCLNGKQYRAWFRDALFIEDDTGNRFVISRDDFYCFWDDIRSKSVFSIPDKIDLELVAALLCEMDYLDPIVLLERDSKEIPGYQLRAGIGRVFALDGKKE